MGSLGLNMGLANHDSCYPKGIAWRKKKYQTYAIVPSFGILQVIWYATYGTMDCFYNEGITQKYVNLGFN
jgi:hypothetical protein